jgi:hypothetical protein
MNESRLKIRPNSSIEIRVFLSSHFLSLQPSKGYDEIQYNGHKKNKCAYITPFHYFLTYQSVEWEWSHGDPL